MVYIQICSWGKGWHVVPFPVWLNGLGMRLDAMYICSIRKCSTLLMAVIEVAYWPSPPSSFDHLQYAKFRGRESDSAIFSCQVAVLLTQKLSKVLLTTNGWCALSANVGVGSCLCAAIMYILDRSMHKLKKSGTTSTQAATKHPTATSAINPYQKVIVKRCQTSGHRIVNSTAPLRHLHSIIGNLANEPLVTVTFHSYLQQIVQNSQVLSLLSHLV